MIKQTSHIVLLKILSVAGLGVLEVGTVASITIHFLLELCWTKKKERKKR